MVVILVVLADVVVVFVEVVLLLMLVMMVVVVVVKYDCVGGVLVNCNSDGGDGDSVGADFWLNSGQAEILGKVKNYRIRNWWFTWGGGRGGGCLVIQGGS